MNLTLAATIERNPEQIAVIDAATGQTTSYRQLEDRSVRVGQLLAALGLQTGDRIAILMDNTSRYLEIAWAAQRSGLLFTPINWHLSADEARYIVEDCDAKVLFATPAVAALAGEVAAAPSLEHRYCVGGPIQGFDDIDEALAGIDEGAATLPALEGMAMFYSSGTTGRPKGIVRTRTNAPYGTGVLLEPLMAGAFGFDPNTVYLCPAPLYHAAPLGWSMGTLRLGGTIVLMRNFDAAEALALIEKFKVTHAQFVPTMFVRMLKLAEAERARYGHSSLRVAIHAAAPCPIDVKEQMIAWWGPVIHEYYAGSEGNGFCMIDSPTWLSHRGSVGRPALGSVHILDEEGNECPMGEVGTIYFEGTAAFEYHNDPAKTASAFNTKGWSTLGDLGHIDAEGFVYLSDRRSHLIISGGVNIYPQEIENVLALHPKVVDVAVIGVPDAEMGESVKAVVQPLDMSEAGPELAAELIAYCQARIARFKCPRSVDFDPDLPRLPTGKLFKRRLMDRYRPTT